MSACPLSLVTVCSIGPLLNPAPVCFSARPLSSVPVCLSARATVCLILLPPVRPLSIDPVGLSVRPSLRPSVEPVCSSCLMLSLLPAFLCFCSLSAPVLPAFPVLACCVCLVFRGLLVLPCPGLPCPSTCPVFLSVLPYPLCRPFLHCPARQPALFCLFPCLALPCPAPSCPALFSLSCHPALSCPILLSLTLSVILSRRVCCLCLPLSSSPFLLGPSLPRLLALPRRSLSRALSFSACLHSPSLHLFQPHI